MARKNRVSVKVLMIECRIRRQSNQSSSTLQPLGLCSFYRVICSRVCLSERFINLVVLLFSQYKIEW